MATARMAGRITDAIGYSYTFSVTLLRYQTAFAILFWAFFEQVSYRFYHFYLSHFKSSIGRILAMAVEQCVERFSRKITKYEQGPVF
jgi:hypothetical protein